MEYNTVYVGMDVHKDSFSLCCYTNEKGIVEHPRRMEANVSKVLKYLQIVRTYYGEDAVFICGYEAGCLGFSLYHELTACNVNCIILAPTTMVKPVKGKKIKTDKRDAAIIARCLAHNDYSAVHIPTEHDDEVKEFIRMRNDHKLALKKIKQQILAFCLRHGYRYRVTLKYWTVAHIAWLRALKPGGLYGETLTEYLITYEDLNNKVERLDRRIEELASEEEYHDNVKKLTCFLGIKTLTALSIIVEVGDFRRFKSAQHFASYIGLVPGENSSGEDRTRLGITKAGNRRIRTLLVEAAQSYGRGHIGYKSKALKERQSGNPPAVIAYADRANERLRRRYYRFVLAKNKMANVAKTAIARELACFIWGMMTKDIA